MAHLDVHGSARVPELGVGAGRHEAVGAKVHGQLIPLAVLVDEERGLAALGVAAAGQQVFHAAVAVQVGEVGLAVVGERHLTNANEK